MNGQVVGYVRVSTLDQNVARQVEAIGSVDKLFVDRASGRDVERPELARLREYAREGDVVVVSSMDRLARSVVDLHRLVDEMTAKGVTVRFLRENLVFGRGRTDPTQRLLLSMMGAVAEFERALIRERQAEGIALARKRGVYKGRTRRMSAAMLAEARQRLAAGVPKARVARDLGVSRQTLYDAMAGRGAYAEMAEQAV